MPTATRGPSRVRAPTIQALREVCQVPIKGGALWQDPVYRFVSIYVTRVAVAVRASANEVTGVSLLAGLVGGALWLWPSTATFLVAAVLLQIGMLLDYVDGEVARWNGKASVAGRFIEGVGGDVTDPLILLAVAWGVSGFVAPELAPVVVGLGVAGAVAQVVFRWTPQVMLACLAMVYMGQANPESGEATPAPITDPGAKGWLGRGLMLSHPVYRRLRAPFFHPNFLMLLTGAAVCDAAALALWGSVPVSTAVVVAYGVATPIFAIWQILHAAFTGEAERRYIALFVERTAFKAHL